MWNQSLTSWILQLFIEINLPWSQVKAAFFWVVFVLSQKRSFVDHVWFCSWKVLPLLAAQGVSNPVVFGLFKLLGVHDGLSASWASGCASRPDPALSDISCFRPPLACLPPLQSMAFVQGERFALSFDVPPICLWYWSSIRGILTGTSSLLWHFWSLHWSSQPLLLATKWHQSSQYPEGWAAGVWPLLFFLFQYPFPVVASELWARPLSSFTFLIQVFTSFVDVTPLCLSEIFCSAPSYHFMRHFRAAEQVSCGCLQPGLAWLTVGAPASFRASHHHSKGWRFIYDTWNGCQTDDFSCVFIEFSRVIAKIHLAKWRFFFFFIQEFFLVCLFV